MACFERASPALKEILLRIYRADKPVELDQHLYEFGSVEYHVQASDSDPYHTYLSISTPLIYQEFLLSSELPRYTIEKVKGICPDVVEIVEPPKEGYQLTLRLNNQRISCNKDPVKLITNIASVQGVIMSSQLKDMLMNANSLEVSEGMYRPLKLTYHPREPFFVIKQYLAKQKVQPEDRPLLRMEKSQADFMFNRLASAYPKKLTCETKIIPLFMLPMKITAVFPMRFKDNTDVVVATAFFQELMDVGSSKAFAKVPHCIWSPIPPPELRGELIEDLSTNGGFVSFDIYSRHVEGKRLDKTVWNLLNFYALVKYHVKSTRSFIQRRMRNRLQSLVKVLHEVEIIKERQNKKKVRGYKRVKKLVSLSKSKIVKQKYSFMKKIKRIHSRLKIHWLSRFHKRWLTFPRFSSLTKYERLD